MRLDFCDKCGADVPALDLEEDPYFRCRRCVENWESSQEGPFSESEGRSDYRHQQAWLAKEGR